MSMPPIPEHAERQVAQAVSRPVDSVIDRIAEQLRGAAGVTAVYGAAVEREGVTVIPVAKIRWGFGGGSGSGEGQRGRGAGSGSGGGGGVSATPLGYIELRAGASEFKPIRDPASVLMIPPVILAAGVAMALVISTLRRLARR